MHYLFLCLSLLIFTDTRMDTTPDDKDDRTELETKESWYLSAIECGMVETVCCCADGNSYICDVQGIAFECIPRGIFECGNFIECHGVVNCDDCCASCA